MKEKKLREMIRSQIKNTIKEDPDKFSRQIRGLGGLSRAKSGLDVALGKIDTDAIAKLNRSQKVRLLSTLLSNVGITAQDFAAIKSAVGRNLASTIAPADESVNEKTDFEMQKA